MSTADQGLDGHGMGAQRDAITEAAATRGWTLLRIEEEVLSGKGSGRNRHERITRRPRLSRALDDLDAGQADVLVVSRLDRLSRSVPVTGEVLERAEEGGWAITALDNADLDMTTAAGEMFAGVLIVFARYERRVIRDRIKAGLAHAKEHGTKTGRPIGRPTVERDDLVRSILAARESGESYGQIANWLMEAGVPTANGGQRWYPSTVRNIVVKAEAYR